MIPIIGLMIGTYIFARMLETAMTPGAHIVVRIVAVLVLLLDLILLLLLMGNSMQIPTTLR